VSEEKKPKRRGPKIVKIEIPAAVVPVAPPVATKDRLIDLGVHVDAEGRYKLRYKVDVARMKQNARAFVERVVGAQAGSIFDGLLGRKDEEEEEK
jgi:hypothetical protein